MSFDSSSYLRRATGRAKSDVANKLVSMFLHEVSRKLTQITGLTVSDPKYITAVVNAFGHDCLYCGKKLEKDRVAVEHLDGMNRFRTGLHVPGNVGISCKQCNNEKRRDDQKEVLSLADSGWESFLSHEGESCPSTCKTCLYWRTVWPESEIRISKLHAARNRIKAFRKPFKRELGLALRSRSIVKDRIEKLYRDCQSFASKEIKALSEEVLQSIVTDAD